MKLHSFDRRSFFRLRYCLIQVNGESLWQCAEFSLDTIVAGAVHNLAAEKGVQLVVPRVEKFFPDAQSAWNCYIKEKSSFLLLFSKYEFDGGEQHEILSPDEWSFSLSIEQRRAKINQRGS